MKRKWLMKAISLMLAGVMIFSLAGCKKSEEEEEEAGKTSRLDKEHVFRNEEIKFPTELSDIRSVFYQNDRVYVIGVNYDDGGNQNYLCSANLDGSDAKSVLLKTGYEKENTSGAGDSSDQPEQAVLENTDETYDEGPAEETTDIWFNQCIMDSSSRLYGAAELYRNYPDEDGNPVSESTTMLFCWNGDGELVWEKNLNEEFPDQEYLYVANFFLDQDDLLWMTVGEGNICSVSADAVLEKRHMPPEMEDAGILKGKDGKTYLLHWNDDYTKQFIQTLDLNTMNLGEEVDITEIAGNMPLSQEGKVYDFLLLSGNEMFGYNVDDEKPTEIMDFIDSDLLTGIQNVQMIDDTHFVALYWDSVEYIPRVAYFSKVPAEEVKDKTPIILAGVYVDWEVKQRIVEFNKTSPTYRMQVREYSKYMSSDDYMGGYTKLNNDIIAGNIPDILLVDDNMPFSSYVSKGLVSDLYPFMDNDPEIKREDYLENVFDAYAVDGKLYQLVSSFDVNSVIGKTSKVGNRSGWNMEEFDQVMDSLPDDVSAFNDNVTRESILYTAMSMTFDEYVDRATGECRFDSDDFIRLLELANEFPKEIDPSVYDDEQYWEDMQSACREDRALLSQLYMSDYMSLKRAQVTTFGEDVTLIGFPTKGKNGHTLRANASTNMAISSKSAVQDGAWEFIRYYLLDEYQDEVQGMFPVKRSALETLAKKAMERPYWINEDTGEKEYYDDTVWVNGEDIILEPLTQEEADRITEFLSGINMHFTLDPSVWDIIMEEANVYFEGQKTAEDVAAVIQSRISLYISENS